MTVTTAQLSGYFKNVWADKLANAVPDFAKIRAQVPFKRQDKIGENYNFPVKLSRSLGSTWNGGATVGTAFTLNDPISMVTKQAQLTGSEFVLREYISYGAISRSGTANDESYGPVIDEVTMEMTESANFNQELALLYGGSSIGTIQTDSNPDFVISAATWGAGIWAQFLNGKLDCYDSTLVTKRNTNAALVVSDIDSATRTITLTGNASDLTACNAGDVFVPYGAVGNWFAGMDKIITNTGTLFNINAATYDLWRGNTYSAASAALTMNKIQAAASAAVVRGLMEDVDVFMSPYSWTDLNNDLAALRRYAEDTRSEMTLGTEKITYFGVSGKISLQSHPMVKAGECFIVPLKRWKRIGSSDVTFQLPDMPQGEFFRHVDNAAAVELRNYFDLAMVTTHPARSVKVTNIVNASGP